MGLYPRLMKFANEQPWALKPETLVILEDVLRFRSSGQRLTDEEIKERIQEYGSPRPKAAPLQYFDPERDETFSPAYDPFTGAFLGFRGDTTGAPLQSGRPVVAIVNVFGVIVQRGDEYTEMSGGASLEAIDKRFTSARDDAAVRAIVLRFDTPGGGVYGVEEFARKVFDARDVKPIFGSCDSEACSAGFWIFGACGDRSITPSGTTGSHGVYSLHQDVSKLLEMEGRKYSLIKAGQYKVEANPFEPLSDEAREFMQQRVNEYYDAFTASLAKFYGISPAKVRAEFGQGRAVGADQAKAAGMVDRIEAFDATLRRAAGRKAQGGPGEKASTSATQAAGGAQSPWSELIAAQADADRLIFTLPEPVE